MNMIDLRVGDVLILDRVEYFVEMVNESRARCQPLTRSVKTVTISGVERQMTCASGKRDVSISPIMEPGHVLRRLTPAERIKFLGKAKASMPPPRKTQNTDEANTAVIPTDMKNKTTEKKDRSLKGCSTAIHALAAKGMKPENIIVKIKETWPACSLGGVMTVLKSKARKEERAAAKASKATAKAAKAPKASKAPPAKKSAPKAKASAPVPPAPKKKGPPVPPKAKSAVPPVPASTPPPAPAAVEAAPAPAPEGFVQS